MIKELKDNISKRIKCILKEYKEKNRYDEKIHNIMIELHRELRYNNEENNWNYHPFEMNGLISSLCFYGVEKEEAIRSIRRYKKRCNGTKKNVSKLRDNVHQNFNYFNSENLRPRETISKKFPDIYLNPLEENIKNLNDYIEEKNNGKNFNNLNIEFSELKKYETLSHLLEKINKNTKKLMFKSPGRDLHS